MFYANRIRYFKIDLNNYYSFILIINKLLFTSDPLISSMRKINKKSKNFS